MDLPQWLYIVIRSVILVFILFLLTRWLGKKQLSHLSFFEYVAGITIGSIAAEISTGLETNFFHGLYSLLIWTAIPFVAGILAIKSKRARKFIEGEATVIIKDGKIQEENLTKEKYSVDELLQLLRNKNAFQVADVEFAVLETNGELNVMLKKEKQPLTASDLQMDVPPTKVPQSVIKEGKIMDAPLAESGYNRAWLEVELEKLNVALDNVYIGQIDCNGQLTVDVYDDQISIPTPQVKPLLLAALKKCQADLESYALETDSIEAKEMYKRNAGIVEQIIAKSSRFLTP
ncbi:DUF421 domain-containing protein [Bacillus sp. FJAT-50079]|uniref:DUF421 domain-containing protein n=1 Tax=Bacillus sp. FJAT-50079 TaxID=2833577 RepID=UPI001BCA4D70|nr:DUF421 domain-containing protein [Bacillus sp. FJAT-50079]MBS4209907.1 DUF421 domain-containing protein [Bacillus sp. FJAT-50079]